MSEAERRPHHDQDPAESDSAMPSRSERAALYDPAELRRILKLEDDFTTLVTAEEAEHLALFADALSEANRRMNLSSLTEARAIAYLHFWDSLSPLPFLEEMGFNSERSLRVADIGSGAGFPGIPLQILRPAWQFTLIDSLKKRVDFLLEIKNRLGLEAMNCLHLRAEDAGHLGSLRESFDLVTARAVARLNVLLELSLPLLKTGGLFVAMKALADEELSEAQNALTKLGGRIVRTERFVLPDAGQQRSLLFIKKERPCALSYPRTAAKIKQRPL